MYILWDHSNNYFLLKKKKKEEASLKEKLFYDTNEAIKLTVEIVDTLAERGGSFPVVISRTVLRTSAACCLSKMKEF